MTAMVIRLDGLGKGAWIAAMVLGFVLFWPIGLAILIYMIASGRMGCGRHDWKAAGEWETNMHRMHERMNDRMARRMARWGCRWGGRSDEFGFRPSGNQAFDEYRAETIRRLEDEAQEFRDFLERLRHAKDKQEFDDFMRDRKNRPNPPPARPEDGAPPQG